jgi:hypothetical protein
VSLLRVFCEGSRSEPHERTAMVRVPHLCVNICEIEGCQNSITDERAHRAVPAGYRALLGEWGEQFADLADIGAIDVIDVGLWDLQVEYPRVDQVK